MPDRGPQPSLNDVFEVYPHWSQDDRRLLVDALAALPDAVLTKHPTKPVVYAWVDGRRAMVVHAAFLEWPSQVQSWEQQLPRAMQAALESDPAGFWLPLSTYQPPPAQDDSGVGAAAHEPPAVIGHPAG